MGLGDHGHERWPRHPCLAVRVGMGESARQGWSSFCLASVLPGGEDSWEGESLLEGCIFTPLLCNFSAVLGGLILKAQCSQAPGPV